ncbi:hypothetical protein BLL52_0903 [Rhodoferax antarcticus ANT.BR]|uniref:Uncharacterized protein n=1 Tax=Rhodoferax antarcticus ANT.BR TaxID=1111071 RepID=A0A1Q8YIJ8_9BURK|nr:hypothetical protein BLL52_0903 [Rhodoferax antarcticus ANT.BR]
MAVWISLKKCYPLLNHAQVLEIKRTEWVSKFDDAKRLMARS